MNKLEKYTNFFEELGITDNTQREYIMVTLYKLSKLILTNFIKL